MTYNQPPFDEDRRLNFPWFPGNASSGWPSFGGQGQPGFGPPHGSPTTQPGFKPPYGGPSNFPGGQQQTTPPSSPPPAFTPQQPATQQEPAGISTFAIDPGTIAGCLFQFTYIWLRWGGFWFYPISIGPNSIAGFRWQRNRWVYYGIDLNSIQSFQCF